VARPLLDGFGPSFTTARFTYSRSTSTASLASRARYSAFATAEASVFSICFAACFLENFSSASASFTSLPRIWSMTSRIL
jgi:hypothetical protein